MSSFVTKRDFEVSSELLTVGIKQPEGEWASPVSAQKRTPLTVKKSSIVFGVQSPKKVR